MPPGKGVDFMAGTWRSSTDLTTQGGDDVVRPQYTFDKDGKGRTRIIQKNGVVCEGPATAQRDDQGRLVIGESEPLKFTDGTSYAPSTVTCQTDAAAAGVQRQQRRRARLRRYPRSVTLGCARLHRGSD